MLKDIFTKCKDGKAVNMNFSHIFTTSKSYCKGMFSCSVFTLHINFFNLNEFSFQFVCSTQIKMYQESCFWGAFLGTVYCRIAGASGGFAP